MWVLMLPAVCVAAPVPIARDADLPDDAPDDGVMAPGADVLAAREWAAASFTGAAPALRGRRADLNLIRQDHSVLQFGRSCIDTPLRLGSRNYEHGLGTHAASAIEVAVPEGATGFAAEVGIDNNEDTGGTRGSVWFAVEVDGAEVARTETLRGGREPTTLQLALPPGAHKLTLRVDPTEDGAAYDQADWADAHFVMADGSRLYLDANQLDMLLGAEGPPFSFRYGDQASSDLLPGWERTGATEERVDRVIQVVRWRDPVTGLAVTAEATCFLRYPAVEWLLTFENTGTADTPILSDIRALDVGIRSGYFRRPLVLHRLEGDSCGERSFLPLDIPVASGRPYTMASTGGRSSSISAFPFWNVEYAQQGVICAIGWSGQWSMTLDRAPNGPARMRAGMETTHFTLHPGEKVRGPRVLVMPWRGDRVAAHNRFRRLILFKYAPRPVSKPALLPVSLQCFDRYNWARPEWATEAGQLRAAEAAKDLGFDTLWFDAGWFPGNFPNGVGNWTPKPDAFPRGLSPVAASCHEKGLRFVLWFEPERAAAGTETARDHPEWVFGGAAGGLFRLSDPDARAWVTDRLSTRIADYGVDIYRNDFNMDPLPSWRADDAPDRQGITEIRYIEGLYAMWDELRARHPGLLMDNCAGGGRRIDLEMCMRSVPFWRSDTNCGPGHADWNQAQTGGLSQYLPLHMACAYTPDAYEVRSAATAGLSCEFDYLGDGFPSELARAAMAEAHANQPYWYGDFYLLAPVTTTPDHWAAWQLHRPDLNAGVAFLFRRSQSPYPVLAVGLRGLDAATKYAVEFVDEARDTRHAEMTGAELMAETDFRLAKGESALIRYRPTATP
jgi:alpha-galactosidase